MRRIAELDGLRGLAALAVVGFHFWYRAVPWGWAAVDLFFVLSGYLITQIVLEHGQSRGFFVSFYARRALRIWPIYYLVLLLLAAFGLATVADLRHYLTYTQFLPCYLGHEMPRWTAMEHTWSLAVEEQFYIVWPLLVVWAGRRRTVLLSVGCAALAVGARALVPFPHILLTRCDGLALGSLLAAWQSGLADDAARRRFRGLVVGAGAFAALNVLVLLCWPWLGLRGDRPPAVVSGKTVASFASLALVAATLLGQGKPILAPLRSRALVYLGTISYGIYLYHAVLLAVTAGVFQAPGLYRPHWERLGVLGLTLAVAALSWHLIERPLLAFKDRFPYGKPAPADAAEGPAVAPAPRLRPHGG